MRGIAKVDYIIQETGGVTADLFLPNSKTIDLREDKGEEVSINWDDDSTVVDFTLKFKKDGSNYQFPHGVVRLKVDEVHRINNYPTMNNPLSYERKKIESNPYHGNIVFKNGLTPRVKKLIANFLAVSASAVITRDDLG